MRNQPQPRVYHVSLWRHGFLACLIVPTLLATSLAQAPVVRKPPQAPTGNEIPIEEPKTQKPVDQGDQVETLRVQTRLVNIPLNVVDASGAPVGGLEKDQFEIKEDGKTQKIAIFERESATPLSIVLCIDSSESLISYHKLEREAGKKFVKALVRQQDEIALLDFAYTVREVVPFTNDAKKIDEGLGQLQNGDETALYEAIYLASDRLKDTNPAGGRRRVIVLISDGDNTKKGTRYAQALEQAQRVGAMVYSLIIVPIWSDAGRNTGGEHALIQLSQDTGGKYFYVQDKKDLVEALQHVSDDLRTQYLLGYYAPTRGADTSFRSIKLTLIDPGLAAKFNLRYRNGYYADAR
ncbi:Ca-activated chloride channel family protein [Granulicella pectinivorans]|jgi:Ca-activated chloride channel family protein|uniref:Ca-activated chloride channel family protein n=1 Tax=Granulicella pectinivorans TaxID=474950 RepID=A0A1I6M7I3_9BACT|nr:VWA domain-containing protein [Granulicella pectinivorans]SFS11621.1 Ca-activated chloride channel family protein [Granulicella pectinivorans]